MQLCKRENLSVITHGIIISRTKKFIVESIEIFGVKYENKNYNHNHFKVDMDNFILFKSSIGEQILVIQNNQSRIIDIHYDISRIDIIINQSKIIDSKETKLYVLQCVID